MPMGNGKLFLAVKAGIRKQIKKQAGDFIHVTLFADDMPVEIPEEFKCCLLDEPNAFENFMKYTDGEQKAFIDWIYSAGKEDTRIERMAKSINKIARGQKLANDKKHLWPIFKNLFSIPCKLLYFVLNKFL